jgi:cell division protein FtsI/penicillin-binding protein 2
MGQTPRLVPALAAVALAATLVSCSNRAGPESAINGFLDGWRNQKFASTVQLISANGGSLGGDAVATEIKAISGDLASVKPTLKAGKANVTKDDASVPIDVSWAIENGVTWAYQTTLRLHYQDKSWHPIFEPSVIAADLTDNTTMVVKTVDSHRGDILGNNGTPIVTDTPVVRVGIEPDQVVGDPAALVTTVNAALRSVNADVDPTDLVNRINSANPKSSFVDVVTLRESAYEQVKPLIYDLPGTKFTRDTSKLAVTRTFAHALLGTVGPVTKERMDAKPGKYQQGDQVGFGGVEEAYDDQLRGSPGVSVVIPAPKNSDGSSSGSDKVLFHKDPVNGTTVKTTIDMKTENAAEAALQGVTQPSSIVAIRISDGALLAVANGPDASGLDLGLTAQVPPGSMFKTVTATNLLEAGKVDVNTPVACPDTLTVNGYTIHNAEPEGIGTAPLSLNFAKSCNTAFASLAPQLGPIGLQTTAKQLGVGIPWDLGVDVYTGSVSANGDAAEQAAAAFGQGKTTISPVVMAAMAAAISRGQWKQPHLILDPAPVKPAADQPALKQPTVDALKQMMREVVTDGTGVKVKNVPGDPIYGKTGTAEHDNKPTPTHSWFMGFRGDVAFCVFVQDGGMSTDAAVPIAGKFFTNLG